MANHKPRYISDEKPLNAIRGNFDDIFSVINRLDNNGGKVTSSGAFGAVRIGAQTPVPISPPIPVSNSSCVKFYSRTLAMTQNAYVELGSWNIATTGYINKMICINTGKSTDEGAQYYHFCAQKSATGGNWYKVFSIKKQDASGCDLGLEINVDATTASARIYTMRNW